MESGWKDVAWLSELEKGQSQVLVKGGADGKQAGSQLSEQA